MSLLFEPIRIGPLEVKNRIVHSATYESMAGTDGEVTDELVNRYRDLARGEVGLATPRLPIRAPQRQGHWKTDPGYTMTDWCPD